MRAGLASIAVLVLAFLILTSSLGQPGLGPQRRPVKTGKGPELPLLTENLTLTIYNATHVSYLRVEVFGSYADGHWIPVAANYSKRPPMSEPSLPHHTELDRIRVKAGFVINGTLPLPLNTANVSVRTLWDRNGGTFRTAGGTSNYTFTAVSYSYDLPVLLNLTPGKLGEYLAIPPDLRDAVLPIAMTFNNTGLGKYLELINLQYYLLYSKKYSENVTFPEGVDRVAYFLENSSYGTSYDFASALVLLARAIGIPARLVRGYKILPNPERQVINASRFYYWVEVYFNGTGWLTVDPLVPYPHPGQYVPLSAVPERKVINGTEAKFLLLDVKREANLSDLGVMSPLNVSMEVSNFSVMVTVKEKPRGGLYPIALTDREGRALYSLVWFNASSDVEPPGVLRAVSGGSSSRYSLILSGGDNLSVETSNWTKTLSVVSEEGKVRLWFVITPPEGARLGLSFQWIRLKSGGREETVYLPVYVSDVSIVSASSPLHAIVGEPFNVTGRVRAGGSGEKPNGTVVFFSGDDGYPVIGKARVKNGTFKMVAEFPERERPGLKHLNLYFFPDEMAGRYWPFFPGMTFIPMTVIQKSHFNVSREVVTRPGELSLTGKLQDSAGRPIGNATFDYFWGNVSGKGVTDGEGKFTLNLYVGPGEHLLGLVYTGDGLYNGTHTEVHVYGVVVKAPAVVKGTIGKPIPVSAEVEGMRNGTIELTFGNESREIRVVNGSFSVNLGPFRKAGEYTVYLWGTGSIIGTIQVAVVSPLNLTVETREVKAGERSRIVILARDGLGGPVPNIPLHIVLPGFNGTVYTNEDGKAELFLNFTRPGKVTVEVTFKGSTFYLPARTRATIEVVKGRSPLPYLLPLLILPVLPLLVRKRKKIVEEETGGMLVAGGVPVVREGETFEVELLCDGELLVDGKPVGRGRKFRLSLGSGRHRLEAKCNRRRFSVTVEVYPDYRTAVERLYETFLSWASKLINVESLTPREIEVALSRVIPQPEALRAIRESVEMALYGKREPSRESFLRFYRAVERVVGQ
ncbi:transglutaminase domain-containing protein [Thermococcus sp.]|uniref:transglutaminase domain-containing protein n=1 Tax=Thermococcus sp. TaxID=35749 RepID=UPI0026343307|nr:transglutaminase domain-containing protein [Thermococcus sp.]